MRLFFVCFFVPFDLAEFWKVLESGLGLAALRAQPDARGIVEGQLPAAVVCHGFAEEIPGALDRRITELQDSAMSSIAFDFQDMKRVIEKLDDAPVDDVAAMARCMGDCLASTPPMRTSVIPTHTGQGLGFEIRLQAMPSRAFVPAMLCIRSPESTAGAVGVVLHDCPRFRGQQLRPQLSGWRGVSE